MLLVQDTKQRLKTVQHKRILLPKMKKQGKISVASEYLTKKKYRD